MNDTPVPISSEDYEYFSDFFQHFLSKMNTFAYRGACCFLSAMNYKRCLYFRLLNKGDVAVCLSTKPQRHMGEIR